MDMNKVENVGGREIKGKKWDNCNSIMKIYLINFLKRKWSSQRTYMYDLWTLTMVGGLPVGMGSAGCRRAKGKKSGQM